MACSSRMVPELLAGLSQEEAALISDVLSQLTIGANPASVTKAVPPRGVLPNAELAELELAEQAIEQELRGLELAGASGRTGFGQAGHGQQSVSNSPLVPGGFGQAGHGQQSVSNSPLVPRVGASRSHLGSATGVSNYQPAVDSVPFPRKSPDSQQPSVFAGSARQPATTADALAILSNWVMDHGEDGRHTEPQQRNVEHAGAAAVPVEPLLRESGQSQPQPQFQPQQSTSLLQGMREKLRQQQQSLLRASLTSSDASGPAERAAGPQGSQPASCFTTPVTATGASHGYNRGGEAHGRSLSASAGSATQRQRRSPIPPPDSAAAARAFTMLNARTNPERYGSDVGYGDTSGKAPVKLPEDERSARLQQLYERTWQWRKRCEERYAKERQERKASELEGCTFSPKITTASQLIMQGKPPSEVYLELSQWGTPTKHQLDGDRAQRQLAPRTVSPGAAARRTSTHYLAANGAVHGSTSSIGRSVEGSAAPAGAPSSSAGGSTGAAVSPVSASPSKPAVNGPEVGARLYKRAVEQRARLEERVAKQLEAEEHARRFTARVQGVTPRLYNLHEPSVRHLPSGMEECTFHPRTRFHVLSSRASDDSDLALHQRFDNRSNGQGSIFRVGHRQDLASSAAMSASMSSAVTASSKRPKSAPHLRAASERSSARYGAVSPGPNKHDDGRTGAHTTVSISPELDWEEFLARQERFLAERQHKIQQLEQGRPAMPQMSPGSRRLLQERSLRASASGGEGGSGGEGDASGKAASASPARQDRRLRTVLEMYKECTFQPRITRKAAALPSRNVDDLVDGGRSRREEWMEQQRAMQQLREVEGATFKPHTNTSDAYSHVRPRINLKNVDAYLTHEAHKQRQREALRAELESEREALELQHCTFKPQTTPLPAYLIRRLQDQHLQQLGAQQQEQPNSAASWDAGNGSPAALDAWSGLTYAQHADGVFKGSMADYGYMPTEVADATDTDADSAYQRALLYATAYGADY